MHTCITFSVPDFLWVLIVQYVDLHHLANCPLCLGFLSCAGVVVMIFIYLYIYALIMF